MKKRISVVFLLIFSSFLFAEGFSFGIEGAAGINTASISFSNGDKTDLDFIPSYRFGGGIEYGFNEITALRTKVLFHQGNGFSFTDGNGKSKVQFWTVDIPVLLKLTFTGIDTIPGSFSIFGGPNFSIRTGDVQFSHSGIIKNQSIYDSTDRFAVGVEAGAEYSFNKLGGFTIGGSVLFDISAISSNSNADLRRLSIMPYIGYWF